MYHSTLSGLYGIYSSTAVCLSFRNRSKYQFKFNTQSNCSPTFKTHQETLVWIQHNHSLSPMKASQYHLAIGKPFFFFPSAGALIDWNKRRRCVMPALSAVQSPERILWLMTGGSIWNSHTSALHSRHSPWLHLSVCMCHREQEEAVCVWVRILGLDYRLLPGFKFEQSCVVCHQSRQRKFKNIYDIHTWHFSEETVWRLGLWMETRKPKTLTKETRNIGVSRSTKFWHLNHPN